MNLRTRTFLSYYKPYRGLLIADIVCALIVSLTTLILPLCTRYITKNILTDITPNASRNVMLMGLVMLGLIGIYTFCNIFVSYRGHLMGATMERDLRRELFEHLQKLSFRFYDQHRVGQLMTRISNDTFDLGELYHHGPEDIIISLLNFVGAMIILLNINVRLTIVMLIFLPIMTVYVVYFNRLMKRALRTSRDRIGDINAQVEDSLAGIRVVKSFGNEATEIAKFNHEHERFMLSKKAEHRSEAYFYEGLIGLIQVMTLAVILFGAISIIHVRLDLADLLTFLLYVGILIEPIQRFGNFTRLYQAGMTGFERCMEILEIEPDIQDAPNAIELHHANGNIAFKQVFFSYATGNGAVFNNLSLTINAGEYVALVGASGVGKTTLCALIPRFYDVDAGTIELDGIDIRQIRMASLRQHIGIVQQDVYLFAGTVIENIRYGKPDATDEQIIAAAKQAHAHDFIMTLPNGYMSDIGQRGVKLSGGQKQRLSIARVFLKNPPILIFDEATSALDNESEAAIQASLETLAHQRTTIVIAHRLSTIRNAQRIIVLNEHGIAEQGTHDEVLALNGVYANLYTVQARI